MKNSNRLIAEFMGHNLGLDGDGKGDPQSRIYETELGTIDLEDAYSTWNWLMPVVIKCKSSSDYSDSNWESIYFSLEECSVAATYKVVVEFIEDYNEAREPKIITYTDTREAATRCVNDLIKQGYLKNSSNPYFDVQDLIQDEMNYILGLNLDDNFGVKITRN
jgi:hypothetical protein